MFDETRVLFDEVQKLSGDERGPFMTWLVVSVIRDVAYYVVAGIVIWALGRRLIQGIFQAMRESNRERA